LYLAFNLSKLLVH